MASSRYGLLAATNTPWSSAAIPRSVFVPSRESSTWRSFGICLPAPRCLSRQIPASRISAASSERDPSRCSVLVLALITGAGALLEHVPYRAVTVEPFPCRDQQVLFKRDIAWVRRCGRSVAECAHPRCMDAITIDAVRAAIIDLGTL